jgi:hypothetical protein
MVKLFTNKDEAQDYIWSNQTDTKEILCLIDAPDDYYAVVDWDTAINLELYYESQVNK